ncbi:hypothetical protein GGE07_005970 [Sinorhizobium terangae]|uniref:DUF2235 domain-containing protein n=1 Tax=Sinorhizobium terangae TaxID=110322 RepID=A0A6N7LLV7_SINTE|nr:DUF2235 domain-containing protein [Sinorhizobium terangae]MBB4189288.1 hypothetical protein [Sinorhizobium terangae]MQX18198.1 DUF2235 domain-containing protein [Sinorhizobium terangae]
MHLIVFCDGTWNTPDQMDGGLPAPTNVVKLRNALMPIDKDGREQRIYYHPGVGTDGSWWNRIAGGGMGDGLDKNIISAYNWLTRNYESGAKIWLFGFSRGAYTVRSLGGMISRCGLLRTPGIREEVIWSAIDDLFAIYRTPEQKAKAVVATGTLPFHERESGQACKHSIPIHFIGVWDTVGALGVPDDLALLNLIDDPAKHQFHDTDLSPIVANARHAVAIDEMRQSFTPTMWTNVDENPAVRQVWFPGVHCDVGGGYGRCGLSDQALKWMIDEAARLGLNFRESLDSHLAADPLGQLHDSVTGVFKSLKTRPREVPLFSEENALLHKSALDRHKNPPLAQGDYWTTKCPLEGQAATVDVFARDRWNFTGLYLEAGVRYQFSAAGEWMDSGISCGPQGTRDGKFHLGEVVQMASSIWGEGEALYSKLSGNHQIDFWYTRREEGADWFALIGFVANGVLPTADPQTKANFASHEVFVIGEKASFRPSKSGYLYAFANDAWQAYDNNRGSVKLTVAR